MSKLDNAKENKLKNWVFSLRFGYIFRFIFDSELRNVILKTFLNSNQSYPISKNQNKKLIEIKHAYRIILSVLTADLLFWSGIGLIITGLFIPPVMLIGIIFLGVGFLMFAYLNIGNKSKDEASTDTDEVLSEISCSDTDDADEVLSEISCSDIDDTDEVLSEISCSDIDDTDEVLVENSNTYAKILKRTGGIVPSHKANLDCPSTNEKDNEENDIVNSDISVQENSRTLGKK